MWPFLSQQVRTRIAPSPTGMPHLGLVRTALFDYLYARSKRGSFIVRIEDTDQKRSVDASVEHFLEALTWLGIEWDEGPAMKNGVVSGEKGSKGPYWQSKRLDLYERYAGELLSKDRAYYCFCTPEILDEMRKEQIKKKQITRYDGRCRLLSVEEVSKKRGDKQPHVVRLKMPEDTDITFTDEIRGVITINSSEIEDQILLKSDGYPTYHLANVIDDRYMKVTHVMRGEEWITSTPKHVYLYEQFGWDPPKFVHLSLVVGPNKQKLSKRDGSFSVKDLKEAGYLPEAVLNYLALLGWRKKKNDREVYTLRELEKEFDLKDLNKAPAIFDKDKLDWFNAQYIKKLSSKELRERVRPYLDTDLVAKRDPDFLLRLVEVERARFSRLSDVQESAVIYLSDLDYEGTLLLWKTMTKETAKKNLQDIHEALFALKVTQWSVLTIEKSIKELIASTKRTNGEMLWPMRVGLTGRKQSPGPFESAYILGQERTLERLIEAIEKL